MSSIDACPGRATAVVCSLPEVELTHGSLVLAAVELMRDAD